MDSKKETTREVIAQKPSDLKDDRFWNVNIHNLDGMVINKRTC